LANSEALASFPLPLSLGGAMVSIGNSPAYAFSASPTQIYALVPSTLQPGPAEVAVTVNGQTATTTATVVAIAPGLFTIDGKRAAVHNPDFSLNLPSKPAVVGTVIMAYFTGQGKTLSMAPDGQPVPPGNSQAYSTQATTTATIGGEPATVIYSGLAPGFDGLAEAYIQVPNLPAGDYDLVITVGGVASNSGTVSVVQ
jgi:uncharacterized protein (TIGR03437 family)